MEGVIALYIVMLAAFTGYEIIARVPVILHTPLMSGSNFVHGIVLVGAMVALGRADTVLEQVIGFVGVLRATSSESRGSADDRVAIRVAGVARLRLRNGRGQFDVDARLKSATGAR